MNGNSADELKDGKVDQDISLGSDGKLTVYLDSTQFWSSQLGENSADAVKLSAKDNLLYIFELTNLGENNSYYPVLHYQNGNLTISDVMRSAASVITLETVEEGQKEKPFLSNQTMDYGISGNRLTNVLGYTGYVGPNSAYKDTTLRTTYLLWGEKNVDTTEYKVTLLDEHRFAPECQTASVITYPFSSMPVVCCDAKLSAETITDSGWVDKGKEIGLNARLTRSGTLQQEETLPFHLVDMTEVQKVTEADNVSGILVELTNGSGVLSGASGDSSNKILEVLNPLLGSVSGPINGSNFKMIISPSEDNTRFNALIWAGYDSMGLDEIDYSETGLALDYGLMENELSMAPSISDMVEMAKGESAEEQNQATSSNKKNGSGKWEKGGSIGAQLEGYYEAEIAYNGETGSWEIYTLGGGFTVGVSGSLEFKVSAQVGPVPLFAEFEVGGGIQLDFKSAVRYSEQSGLEWDDSVTADMVNDYLTTLRLNAYVYAFGGIGVDYSVVALKIGLFGSLTVDNSNVFLSRSYLEDESLRQLNGQRIDIMGEVGMKIEARLLIFSYSVVLASGKTGYAKNFNDLDYINEYWNNTGSGKNYQMGIASYAEDNELHVAATSTTLQNRDYIESYARTWESSTSRNLRSIDKDNGLANLQTNANPGSYPMITDDGELLLYISDTNNSSIYAQKVFTGVKSGNSYTSGSKITAPAGFAGNGDCDLALAGDGNFAAAGWVRMSEKLEKDAGDDITSAEVNLMLNSSEVVVSVYQDNAWKSSRLTDNATPDLAPAVATNGKNGADARAIAVWRSVYATDSTNIIDFTSRDCVMYSSYDGRTKTWSTPAVLYNGSAGAVKALEAGMLPDGSSCAVFTLDKDSLDDSVDDYEIAYAIVGNDGISKAAVIATSDTYVDENPQICAVDFDASQSAEDNRFVLAWHSMRDNVNDIRLLAVDSTGAVSNAFPESLSKVVDAGGVNINGNFCFAGQSESYRTLDNLVILWPEQVASQTGEIDHSVLTAVQFCSKNGTIGLSAALEVAELPERTLLDHFDAYVSGENQIKAVLQGTWYDPINSVEVEDMDIPAEKTMLYTANATFENKVEVENIIADYANLAQNSLNAMQFTVLNEGMDDINSVTLEIGKESFSFDGLTLAPNESTLLTCMYPVGATVTNPVYTLTASFEGGTNKNVSGTVYLDYPDVGISQMTVVEEKQGMRTMRMTLYNASAATLSGNKQRSVTLGFYDNSDFDSATLQKVTCDNENVTVNSDKTLTIEGEDALSLIDSGSFTLEVTYDVSEYMEDTLKLQEIPDSGIRLFTHVAVLDDLGNTLPEFNSANNDRSINFESLLKRTGEAVTLDIEQGMNDEGNTTATVSLRNNSLQQTQSGNVIATLLDDDGEVLEQVQTYSDKSSLITLDGEEILKQSVGFHFKGNRVTVAYGTLNLNNGSSRLSSLGFDGLPIQLSDFVFDGKYIYEAPLSVDMPEQVLISYITEDPDATVTINGEAVNGSAVVQIKNKNTPVVIEVTGSDNSISVYRIGSGEPDILETKLLTVTAPDFDPVTEGYQRPDAKAITITNTGNSDVRIHSVKLTGRDDVFEISGSGTLESGTLIGAGESITSWTIRPKAGHTAYTDGTAKTYMDTITVTYDGTTDTTATAKVFFTVEPKSSPLPKPNSSSEEEEESKTTPLSASISVDIAIPEQETTTETGKTTETKITTETEKGKTTTSETKPITETIITTETEKDKTITSETIPTTETEKTNPSETTNTDQTNASVKVEELVSNLSKKKKSLLAILGILACFGIGVGGASIIKKKHNKDKK